MGTRKPTKRTLEQSHRVYLKLAEAHQLLMVLRGTDTIPYGMQVDYDILGKEVFALGHRAWQNRCQIEDLRDTTKE